MVLYKEKRYYIYTGDVTDVIFMPQSNKTIIFFDDVQVEFPGDMVSNYKLHTGSHMTFACMDTNNAHTAKKGIKAFFTGIYQLDFPSGEIYVAAGVPRDFHTGHTAKGVQWTSCMLSHKGQPTHLMFWGTEYLPPDGTDSTFAFVCKKSVVSTKGIRFYYPLQWA